MGIISLIGYLPGHWLVHITNLSVKFGNPVDTVRPRVDLGSAVTFDLGSPVNRRLCPDIDRDPTLTSGRALGYRDRLIAGLRRGQTGRQTQPVG